MYVYMRNYLFCKLVCKQQACYVISCYKFGGYDFENAKCQLQALAMRKTIISAKNAYMAEDRKPVSADNLQVGYKIIAMPVQTQSTILAIRQSA